MTRNPWIAMVAMVLVVPMSAALGDWDPDQYAKWVQPPNETWTGVDVNISGVQALGDDFQCVTTDRITDIHLWCSWLNDNLPNGDPNNVQFNLSIWTDQPEFQGEYSRPLAKRWEMSFGPGLAHPFTVRHWATVGNPTTHPNHSQGEEGEFFYTPSLQTPVLIPDGDHEIWQYNFFIDPAEAFLQEGAPDQPITYWLVVQADPLGSGEIGWKTTPTEFNWNDDAVFGAGDTALQWYEMIYPDEHPDHPESINLAFVITPEPATLTLLGLGGLMMLKRRGS